MSEKQKLHTVAAMRRFRVPTSLFGSVRSKVKWNPNLEPQQPTPTVDRGGLQSTRLTLAYSRPIAPRETGLAGADTADFRLSFLHGSTRLSTSIGRVSLSHLSHNYNRYKNRRGGRRNMITIIVMRFYTLQHLTRRRFLLRKALFFVSVFATVSPSRKLY